jgi:hypothetical protein
MQSLKELSLKYESDKSTAITTHIFMKNIFQVLKIKKLNY